MVLDPESLNPFEVFNPTFWRDGYITAGNIMSVNPTEGTCTIRLLEGGSEQDVPLTFPVFGDGMCIAFMPTVGSVVWMFKPYYGPPIILTYMAKYWKSVMQDSRIKQMQPGDIFLRSASGAEIDMNSAGDVTVSDAVLGRVAIHASEKSVEIAAGGKVYGQAGDVEFRFGQRDIQDGEVTFASVEDLQKEGFHVAVSKGEANYPWVEFDGGDIEQGSTDAFRVKVSDPNTGTENASIRIDESGEVNIDPGSQKVYVGPSADAKPVARNADTIKINETLNTFLQAVAVGAKVTLPVPSILGTVQATSPKLEA